MKLYMHPVSTASRPVRLYIAEKNIPCDEVVVDLMKGEHHQEPFVSINPSRQVPVLEDGDLRLTESSAILKYLASKYGHPEYPIALAERAKVDELMDWFNTQFYRDYGYGMTYPQIFPHHKRPSDEQHVGVISWGRDKSQGWLKILDEHWLGPDRTYLRGDQITIADYFGVCLVTLGEVIRCNFATYPNVDRWIATMKTLSSWNRINEAMYGFKSFLQAQAFEAL